MALSLENESGRVDICLLVKEARKAFTKKDDPFLTMKLFDGKVDIQAVKWDFEGNPPKQGEYIYVTARVEEYNNAPQLNVEQIRIANPGEYDPADFLPSLTAEEITVLKEKFWENINSLNEDYGNFVHELFSKNNIGVNYFVAPAAESHHHAYLGGLLEHSVSVCQRALMLADTSKVKIKREILILGALLHDLGKINSYDYDRPPIRLNTYGKLLDHIAIGSSMIGLANYRSKSLSSDDYLHLQHLIISHHGKLEWGSPVVPKTPEAEILHLADYMDAVDFKYAEAYDQVEDGEQWTGRVRGLGGKDLWLR